MSPIPTFPRHRGKERLPPGLVLPSPFRGEGQGGGLSRMRKTVPRGKRDLARSLRSNMTAAEKLLWKSIRKRQMGVKFRRQVVIGPYIADFLSYDAKLVIELGANQNPVSSQTEADRSTYIRAQGLHLIHFRNADVLENLDNVLTRITTHIQRPCP